MIINFKFLSNTNTYFYSIFIKTVLTYFFENSVEKYKKYLKTK